VPGSRLALLGALVLFVAGATAQTVDTLTPASGTLGSQLTITGTGFGDKAGQVTLVDVDAKKDPRLTIVSWSDTVLEVRVKRAPAAGMTTLEVQPRDGGTATAGFTVLPPLISGFDKTIATPKEQVTITVQDLGNKTPRVDVGWRRVRVSKIKKIPGAPDDREVTFRIPRKAMASGTWNVIVTNSVGQAKVETALQITGSKRRRITRPLLLARIRGVDFRVRASGLRTKPHDSQPNALIVTTGKGMSKDKTVKGTLEVTYPPPPSVPTVSTGPPSDQARITYTEVVDGVPVTWTSDGVPLSITLQSQVKHQLAAIFAATLKAAGQPDVFVESAFVSRRP
jgi:hypothetical protein